MGLEKTLYCHFFYIFGFLVFFSENFDGNFLKWVLKVVKTGKKEKNIKNIILITIKKQLC